MYNVNQRREKTQQIGLGEQSDGMEPAGEPVPQGSASAGNGGSSLLGAAAQAAETSEKLHKAVGATLNAQKIMGDALEAVIAFHSFQRSQSEDVITDEAFMERVETAQSEFMAYVGQQAKRLKNQLSEAGHNVDEDWAKARLTSTVAQYAGQYYRYIGPGIFERNVADTLANADEIEGLWTRNALNAATHGGDIAGQRAQQMLAAMGPVVSAYHQFNYFHNDRKAVVSRLSGLLESTVDETLEQHEATQHMRGEDFEALRGHLLYRAGHMLSECWKGQVRETLNVIQDLEPEQRRQVTAQGYPLEGIEDEFRSYFQMIQQTTLIALSQHSGMDVLDPQMDTGPQMSP